MKRGNTGKRIVAVMLCMVIALTGLNVQTISAASGKIPLKVTFNGKTAALVKDLGQENFDYPTVKTLTSKWGKPKKSEVENGGTKDWKYTWKKGKTEVSVLTDPETKRVYCGGVSGKDKNAALCGIKVGMKKDTAVKKLKKALGLKNKDMTISDAFIDILFLEGGAYYGAFSFGLKNGKVSSIFWKTSPSTPLFID